jgi:hypothetical protein
MSSTAIVHEAYLRLTAGARPDLQNRQHSFAVASRVMRHILVDHARRVKAVKRQAADKAPLEEALLVPVPAGLDLVDLEESAPPCSDAGVPECHLAIRS